MGRDVNVKLNLRGLNKLMSGPEATAEVMRAAHRLREAAGPGYEVKASPHPRTAGAVVRAADLETARNDARTNTLLRALGSMQRN